MEAFLRRLGMGGWSGVQCISLAVSFVSSYGTASVFMAYERFIPWNGVGSSAGVAGHRARITSDNKLEFSGSGGRKFIFILDGDVLRGTVYGRKGEVSSFVSLAKRPEHAFWNVNTAGRCATDKPPRARTTTTLIEPGTPEEYQRFAGVWKGQWYKGPGKPTRCQRFALASIMADGSFLGTYYWGKFCEAGRCSNKGSVRVSGRIKRHTRFDGEVLSIDLHAPKENLTATYYLQAGSDVLEAKADSPWAVLTREGPAQTAVLSDQDASKSKKKGRERERVDDR